MIVMSYGLILKIFTYVGFVVVSAVLLLLASFMCWLAFEMFKTVFERTKIYKTVIEFAKENEKYIYEWKERKRKERDRDG